MGKLITYIEGEQLGNSGLVFIKRLTSKKATFKCHCGELFDTSISDVKMNKSKSCGCLKTKSHYRVDMEYLDIINIDTNIKFIEFTDSEKYQKMRRCGVHRFGQKPAIGLGQSGKRGFHVCRLDGG